MKAAVFHGAGRPLKVETIDDPTPGSADVIVKVQRCGVCGTDLHLTAGHAWDFPTGMVLGHEYAGEVVEVGSEVSGLRKGDLITALPCQGCGACDACLQGNPVLCMTGSTPVMGGFAEYVRVPASLAVKLPSVFSAADGALVEPFAVGLYGARMAEIKPGDRVVVLGGGSVALTAIYWAKRLGAGRVVAVSRSQKRADMVLAIGADAFVQAGENEVAEVAEALGGPADIVFECVGVIGFLSQALSHVRTLGKVVSMGFCIDPDAIIPGLAGMKGARFLFPVGYALRDFQHAADVMHDGRFDPNILITSVVPLAGLPEAFEALRGPNSETKLQVSIS